MEILSQFQQDIFAEIALVTKALANGPRLRLLELLAQRPRTVEVLASLAGISLTNASQHLSQLKRAGLVTSRREGQFIHYQLASEEVVHIISSVSCLAIKASPSAYQLLEGYRREHDPDAAETVAQLTQRLREKSVMLIDVRPRDEFEAGHIRGAMSVPIDEFDALVARIPKRAEIVAYCRGPHCTLATFVIARLREKGYRARRLEIGMPQWRLLGLPVEQGAPNGRGSLRESRTPSR